MLAAILNFRQFHKIFESGKSTKLWHIRDKRMWISRNPHQTCPNFINSILAGIFFLTRFAIEAEVIDRFCWYLITNTERQRFTLYLILKKIKAKLRPWRCRIEKVNKIAQGDVNIFSQRDQRVWIRTNRCLTCPVSKLLFWWPFWFFSETQFSIHVLAEVTDRFC